MPFPQESDASSENKLKPEPESELLGEEVCPVCRSKLVQEKCKVVCRSATCGYRIIFNCAEF